MLLMKRGRFVDKYLFIHPITPAFRQLPKVSNDIYAVEEASISR